VAVFIDPRSGERYESVPDEDAERARTEYGLVSEAEYEQERQYGDRGGEAFLNAAAAGAFDTAVSPVRMASELAAGGAHLLGATGAENELRAFNQQISGRQVMENITAVLGELAGEGNAEEIARRYSEDARAVAQANPNWSTAGYVGGALLGGRGVAGASAQLGRAAASAATSSALGKTALALATEGAAEGAMVAAGEASEQAFIANERLTSEQVLGAIGLGTFIGGGVGGTLGTLGHGVGKARRATDAAGARVRRMFDPDASANADTVAEVAGDALGVKVDRAEGSKIKQALESLRDKAEHAQAAATGADIETIQDYGALRWDQKAIAGRDAFINREAIREGAKRDLTQGLQEFSDAAEPVIDEIRYTGLKRDHVAAAISDNADAQLADARARAAAVEEMLVPMRKPGSRAAATREAGKDAAIDREAYVQTFSPEQQSGIDDELDDEIRETLEALGRRDAKEGGRAWKRVEQDILRERVDRQAPAPVPADPREGSMRGELGGAGLLQEVDRFASRQMATIAKTSDPVEAYMALDQLKRGLQKYADRTGKSARALNRTSPERATGMRSLSDYLERFQEPLRQSLESTEVWGKAGANQKAINAALTRQIEGAKAFRARFLRETEGYRGLDVVQTVREDATSGFINKLGLAENEPTEQFLRAHLRATNDVLTALDGALELGEKKALVGRARETEKRLNGMLAALDENVRTANRIEALIGADADGDGGMGKALLGSLVGGPIGALVGFGADIASSPGKRMRQAIAIQRIARRNGVDIEQAMGRIFAAGKKADAKVARDTAQNAAELADEAEDEISGVRLRPGFEPPPAAAAQASGGGRAAAAPAQQPNLAPEAAPAPAQASTGGARPRSGPNLGTRAGVPAAMAVFLGNHEDKQAAFKQRAREIHAATANFGESLRDAVDRDFGDTATEMPRLSAALVNGLTRGALFLESKLPMSYRAAAPGAQGRSTRPVADHDIAKFARYWSAVNNPVSVLHDMALGIVTAEQIEAIRAVYPELHVELSQQLLEKAADLDAKGQRLPIQTRLQIGRFVGAELEPAFRPRAVDLIDQARQGKAEAATQQPTPRPSAPPNIASSVGPESVQIAQREARVG